MPANPRRRAHSSAPRTPAPAAAFAGKPRERRRTLSQNLLADSSVARRLVRLAGAAPGDRAVEPGSGDGRVTRALRTADLHVDAYEIDPAFAERLRRRFGRDPQVRVIEEDVTAARLPGTPVRMVGNIPFAQTAAIVDRCLTAPALQSAALLVQNDVARKRAGTAGRWTRRTVLSWPEFGWHYAGPVRRDRFRPRPSVDGGLLLIRRRTRPLLPPSALPAYRQLVAAGFRGVGGSLAASLRRSHPRSRVDAALRAAEVDPAAPVGHVSPGAWTVIARRLLDADA